MKNVIITSANAKYGEFLVNHWLKSLKENVDLSNIDIVVIDYGLESDTLSALKSQGVNVFKGTKEGHIVTTRFIDTGVFLKKADYDQVLFIDGGDVIFQDDISREFELNKDSYRATKLDMEVMYFEFFIPKHFDKVLQKELWKVLRYKPVLNAGVIFSPKDKFINLCEKIAQLVYRKDAYGPDQVIVNYVLYKDKVVPLNKRYNFVFGTEREGFIIKDSTFYRKNGEKIAIAHNAGHDALVRPIDNFGYGHGRNKIKPVIYYGRKIVFYLFRLVRLFQLKFLS